MTEQTDQTAAGGLDDFEAALRPLWERARNGDDAAYKVALERIAERLRAWLRRRMQTLPDDVEDLVQETLLGALPQAQRKAIEMTKLEGLTMAEASERSGASVSALKVQVHRGLKRLAELARKTI